ncbi:MAG: YqhA family protein [Acidihalobacter sp.]|uniref:YqhA family protein n=1 Tax=Acidihalobacter sp. TaxID=1872108 RepID=UPI00307E5F69
MAHVAGILGGYLLVTMPLIFAPKLYEFFASKIDEAENSEMGSRVLFIKSPKDLKARLGKVVLMNSHRQIVRTRLGDTFRQTAGHALFCRWHSAGWSGALFSHTADHKPSPNVDEVRRH